MMGLSSEKLILHKSTECILKLKDEQCLLCNIYNTLVTFRRWVGGKMSVVLLPLEMISVIM